MEKEPIRVLQIFARLDRGGAETMIMNYYRNIDRSKIQFDFIVRSEERLAYEDEIESLGGRIFHILPMSISSIQKHKKQIAHIFDNTYYDIVHGHVVEAAYFVFKEAHKRGIPTIAHSHSINFGSKITSIVKKAIFSFQKPLISYYFACGKDASIAKFGSKITENVTILPNAIDVAKFAYSEDGRDRVQKAMGWNGRRVIIHVGRFSKAKNHMFLIEIFNEILKKDTNSILVLVGGHGELLENVKDKIKELEIEPKVQFMGGRDDVYDLLKGADLFLMPSLWEGLPVSIVEAQVSGMAIVTSDRVPNEVRLWDDAMEFISLTKDASYWAKECFAKMNNTIRKDKSDIIIQSGYDIRENAKWLQKFYLDKSIQSK